MKAQHGFATRFLPTRPNNAPCQTFSSYETGLTLQQNMREFFLHRHFYSVVFFIEDHFHVEEPTDLVIAGLYERVESVCVLLVAFPAFQPAYECLKQNSTI